MVLRILALHGFGQNASVFLEKRVKDLVKKLRPVAELHAIDAPHSIPYDASLRGWWMYPEDVWDGSGETVQALAEKLLQQPEFDAIGLQETLDLVVLEWSTGRYDGILGFSQGAIVAAMLCAELRKRVSSRQPRFAILISGFGRPVPRGLEAFPPAELIPIPSLHVWGLADDHIPPWTSEALAAYFEAPQIHTHGGHHFVPQKAADTNVFVDFVKRFLGATPTALPLRGACENITEASMLEVTRVPRVLAGEALSKFEFEGALKYYVHGLLETRLS